MDVEGFRAIGERDTSGRTDADATDVKSCSAENKYPEGRLPKLTLVFGRSGSTDRFSKSDTLPLPLNMHFHRSFQVSDTDAAVKAPTNQRADNKIGIPRNRGEEGVN